jgi:predicted RNA-binding protein Jag
MFDQPFITKKLDKFVALLGMNADVEYDFQEGEEFFLVRILFKGENVGYAIGMGGGKIFSIQNVLLMMLKNTLRTEKEMSEDDLQKLRVFVDIGDYREKKIENLLRNVNRKVEEARILGEPVDLHPMTPAERRAVHLALKKFDDIKTESIGEDRERFVRIIPVSEEELGVLKRQSEESEEQEE